MKTTVSILIAVSAFILSCTPRSFTLSGENKDDINYVRNYISQQKERGQLGSKPVLIVDGTVMPSGKNAPGKLGFKREDIASIRHSAKGSAESKEAGAESSGVVYISLSNKTGSDFTLPSTVLILLDGKKQITQDELKAIDPDTISSIDVIKDRDSIRNYTLGEYTGVIVIHLRKPVMPAPGKD